MACDFFLDALADPDLALKIWEKQLADLDSALQSALQLEVWATDTARLHVATEHRKTKPKRIREITKPKTEATVETLQKEVKEQRCMFVVLENKLLARNNPSNSGYRSQEANRPNQYKWPQSSGYRPSEANRPNQDNQHKMQVVGDVDRHHTEFWNVQLPQEMRGHL